MSSGENVDKTLGECIKTLQDVKKQWSRCIKSYIYIETQMSEISAGDDAVKATLNKLKNLVYEVNKDRRSYKEHYDSILKNCTLGEMLTWAKVNGKRGKLERVIEKSTYYQEHKNAGDDNAQNPSTFFDHILKTFGKIKYKKIGKGAVEGESPFLISLMTAVFDSILKAYIGLVNNENIDEKTRHKMDFGGIKGKDIEKYICKKAGIKSVGLESMSQLDQNTMIGRLDAKRESVDEMKNAMSITALYDLFKNHSGCKGNLDKNVEIKKICGACTDKINEANEALKTVQTSLAKIITEEKLSPKVQCNSAGTGMTANSCANVIY